MSASVSITEDCGLEVIDLRGYPEFEARSLHLRDVATQMQGMQRIAHAFVESPETILQELVNAAVELCDADSAGISLEIDAEHRSDTNYFQWVATAGRYQRFLNATLPRVPSACGTCLERGQPQLFRVTQRFFDLMGVAAPTVTDGLLLPWQVEEMRGTIWIMAHERVEAFDSNDCRMMQGAGRFFRDGCAARAATAHADEPGKRDGRSCHGERFGAPDQQSAAKPDEPCVSGS